MNRTIRRTSGLAALVLTATIGLAACGSDSDDSGSGEDFTVGSDGATVLCGNIPTDNATVYVIDSVLMPGMS